MVFGALLQVNASAVGQAAGWGASLEVQNGLVGVVLILLAVLLLWKFRQYIVNSILGVITLALLGFLGIDIPINIVTVLVAAVLGLVGVGLMVVLYALGFRF